MLSNSFVLISFFSLFLFFCSQLEAAKFISIKGNVSVKKTGTETWISADKKTVLNIMDEVKTGEKSLAEIELVKGYRLNLGSNTIIAIREQGVVSDKGIFPSIMLYMGDVFSSIKKMVVGKVELYTPTSVIGVRGTEFYTKSLPNGTSSLEVKDGLVDFNSVKKDSQAFSVAKGDAAIVDFDLNIKVFKNKKEWDLFIKNIDDNYKQKPELKVAMLDTVLDQILKDLSVMDADYISVQKEIEILTAKRKEAIATDDTNTAIQYNDKIYSKKFDLHNVNRKMKHIQLRARGIKYLLDGTNSLPATIDKILRIESMVNRGGINEVK